MNRSLSLAIVATLALGACSTPQSMQTVPGSSAKSASQHVRHVQSAGRRPSDFLGGPPSFSLSISLFDAPLIGATAANSQFNAGILGVDAIDAKGDSWQLTGSSTPQIVNLLALQNTALSLGTGSLPPGTYPSIQLLLDPATTSVTYNGAVYPARFVTPNHPWWDPTQTVEAVSVPLSVTGNASDAIKATLDFNVFQSADLRDGIVYLTPTIAGGIGDPVIAGTVVNAAGAPVSDATIVATDANGYVANTALSAADGSYHLRGISAGGYTLSVKNTFTTNAGVTVTASGADPGAAPSAYVVVGPNGTVNVSPLLD